MFEFKALIYIMISVIVIFHTIKANDNIKSFYNIDRIQTGMNSSLATNCAAITKEDANNEPIIKPYCSTGCCLQNSSTVEKSLMNKVNLLKGLKFQNQSDSKYFFSVCSKSNNGISEFDGMIQLNSNNDHNVIGRTYDIDLEGTEDVIRMTYRNGDKYPETTCNEAEREAVIYIICNRKQQNDTFRIIEENNVTNCEFIFELKTNKTCSNATETNGTSSFNFPSVTFIVIL